MVILLLLLIDFAKGQEPLKVTATASVSATITEPLVFGLIKTKDSTDVLIYSPHTQISDTVLIKTKVHIFVMNCE